MSPGSSETPGSARFTGGPLLTVPVVIGVPMASAAITGSNNLQHSRAEVITFNSQPPAITPDPPALSSTIIGCQWPIGFKLAKDVRSVPAVPAPPGASGKLSGPTP